MAEFNAALRQLQRPLVMLAVAILLLQTLVAGLADAQAAARIAAFGADGAVICHSTGDDGPAPTGVPTGHAAHDCCAFCSNAGPLTLPAGAPGIDQPVPTPWAAQADRLDDVRPTRRAIRAGPSQAPPTLT